MGTALWQNTAQMEESSGLFLNRSVRVASCYVRRWTNKEHEMRSTEAVQWCARSTFQTNSGLSFHRSLGQSHRKCFPISALATTVLNFMDMLSSSWAEREMSGKSRILGAQVSRTKGISWRGRSQIHVANCLG